MAMSLVRKQLYLTREQDRRVKRLAAQLKVTEAEVVRRALDQFQEGPVEPYDPTVWLRELGRIAEDLGEVDRRDEASDIDIAAYRLDRD
ncbi:MAG: hypothetical protein ACYDAY_01025 [Candidatus Dormibacteria bacterium]